MSSRVGAVVLIGLVVLAAVGACADGRTGPAPTGAFAAACTVTQLPLPTEPPPDGHGWAITVRGIDPTGRYVVGAQEFGAQEPGAQEFGAQEPGAAADSRRVVSVLWEDGVPRILTVPTGGHGPDAVNQHGWVVGEADTDEGSPYAWVVVPGRTAQRLPTPAGWPENVVSTAAAINERGEIAGSLGDGYYASRWRPDAQGHYDVDGLELLPGDDGEAVGITDDGTVVGRLNADTHPYVWRVDGSHGNLPLPTDTDAGRVLAARGDWAVGVVYVMQLTPSTPLPARWNLHTHTVEELPGAGVLAVNARGDVIYLDEQDHRLVLRDGQTYDLASSPDTRPARYGGPSVFSDDGRVLAGSPPTAPSPLVWHC